MSSAYSRVSSLLLSFVFSITLEWRSTRASPDGLVDPATYYFHYLDGYCRDCCTRTLIIQSVWPLSTRETVITAGNLGNARVERGRRQASSRGYTRNARDVYPRWARIDSFSRNRLGSRRREKTVRWFSTKRYFLQEKCASLSTRERARFDDVAMDDTSDL